MSRKNRINEFSEHHLTPKSKGGKGRSKIKVPHNEHVAWHILVQDVTPKEAAKRLSYYIPRHVRFFAVDKNYPYDAIEEISAWLGKDFTLRVKKVNKECRIIQFKAYYLHRSYVSAEEKLPS